MSMVFEKIRSKIEEFDSWEDEYARRAMNDLYGFFHRLSFIILNLSPKYAALSIGGMFLACVTLLTITVLLAISTVKMSDDFEDYSGEANLGALSFLAFIFLVNHNYHRKSFLKMHHMLGKGFHNYDEPQFSPKEVEEYNGYLKKLYVVLMFLASYVVFIAILVVFICPYIDRQLGFGWEDAYDENGVNRQLPVPLWTPFKSDEGVGYWFSLMFLEMMGGATFTLSIGASSLLFTGISGGLLLEEKLLVLSIKNLEKRAKLKYVTFAGDSRRIKGKFFKDPIFQKCIEYCLKQNVIHHQAILKYNEKYVTATRVPLVASFAIETIAIAMSMIKLNEGSSKWGANIAFGCIAIAELANMIMLCVLGEQITTLGDEINEVLFSSKWYKFNMKNRKFLLQFLVETQTPIKVGAMGLVSCSMEQFSQVMNSAYSFFNLLKVSKALEE